MPYEASIVIVKCCIRKTSKEFLIISSQFQDAQILPFTNKQNEQNFAKSAKNKKFTTWDIVSTSKNFPSPINLVDVLSISVALVAVFLCSN